MIPEKSSFTIHDLPVSERPRERLQKFGAENMSAQDLLAIILGRGIAGESVTVTAQQLLKHFKDVRGLHDASLEQLREVRGIGLAKAAQIKAAFALADMVDTCREKPDKTKFGKPEEVYGLVKNRLKDKKKEYFIAMLLDTRSRLIKIAEISVGSLDSSIVHPREVFKEAISASAASMIFVHNHPSGDCQPSKEDVALTRRLVESGELIGITVLDHVIIGDGEPGFLSFKREGLL